MIKKIHKSHNYKRRGKMLVNSRQSKKVLLLLSLILSSSIISTTWAGRPFPGSSKSTTTTTAGSPPLLISNLFQRVQISSTSSSRRQRQDGDGDCNLKSWKSRPSQMVEMISRRGQTTLSRSMPSLNVYNNNINTDLSRRTLEVSSVKTRKRRRRTLIQIPPKEQFDGGGFYYGVSKDTMSKAATPSSPTEKKPKLSESMSEALEELKYLRQEMERMRKDMQTLKQRMVEEGDIEGETAEETRAKQLAIQRKRQKESEKLAVEIEDWAKKLLKETEDDGWKEVPCGKVIRGTVNPTGRTTAYLKWMKDSRGDKAVKTDDNEYPCIKCYSTIDAPLEDVCTYLSQESAATEYNDVVTKFKDVEEISPSAKITWSQSPQILFVKPREFITFCHHRWKRDGTEVIVNQAWDHPDYPATNDENAGDGKSCRALALRGANFLSRDPDDPEKTRAIIIAHANPGGNIPKWATKTAVNALAPIEPYKLFHKINVAVQKNKDQVRQRLQQADMVSTQPPGRSPRPAGIAQLGYACFWPNGGGIDVGGQHKKQQQQQDEQQRTVDGGDDNNTGGIPTTGAMESPSGSVVSEPDNAESNNIEGPNGSENSPNTMPTDDGLDESS